MNINKIDKRIFLFVFLAIALMLLLMCNYDIDKLFSAEAPSQMEISLNSGFYSKEQKIRVEVPQGTVVYYTEDCTEPTKENGVYYESPISIIPEEEEKVYVYRFKAYYDNGEESEVITRTYFVGDNITNRYTTNVLHITGEPDDLFGYENGIFVPGKIFDEFVAANPDAHLGAGVEANFKLRGKESERAVYIECFSADGSGLFAQEGGVRIHGAASRLKNQKSFKLYARKEYDEVNEFNYPIVKNLVSAIDGTVAQEHKRLIIRSGGNDNGFGYIRSEIIAELASQAGFPDVMHSEPMCVYINGEYRGIYWVENTFDSQYFVNRYGEYEGNFVILQGSDINKKDEEDAVTQQYVAEYNELYQKFSSMDLTKEENYNALCAVLDVENYLAYFALQNYIGNMDWPTNNLKVYRYVGEEYTEGTVFDGKYRHLFFDTDYGFGLMLEYGNVGIREYEYTLNRLLGTEEEPPKSPLFVALMKREDCRNYFINYSCDLMNGVMRIENVSPLLAEKHGERSAELRYMLEETDIQKDSLWFWEGEYMEEYSNVETEYSEIIQFVDGRGGTVLVDMILSFGLEFEQAYTLFVNKGNCFSQVKVNSNYIDEESFEGPYIGNAPVEITPVIAENEIFEHWVVNGQVIKEEKLVLTGADIVEAEIHVEMVTSTKEDPIVQLSAVRAKGLSDFIEIVNLSTVPISTRGYYLTDNDKQKSLLPSITLMPGEKKRFYGKDCKDMEAIGQYCLNFNIKEGETISLMRGEKVLESLIVPDLSYDGIYRRQGISDVYKEEL